MLQGYYTAASGMLMQQRQLNIISNNLANNQTPGFKAKELHSETFEQTLLTRLEGGRFTGIGKGSPIRVVSEVSDLFQINGQTETGYPFDMALAGSGFFNIQAADGTVYLTRNGEFNIDDEAYLVLPGKGRVMGTGGPIRLNTSDITVNENGVIRNSETNEQLATVLVTLPVEDAVIEQAANGMYTVTEGAVNPSAQPMITQGALEQSNVNLTDELSAMIMAQRNFSSASQALQIIDQTNAKAVNIASL